MAGAVIYHVGTSELEKKANDIRQPKLLVRLTQPMDSSTFRASASSITEEEAIKALGLKYANGVAF